MGASFTNCQVRSNDANAVVAALAPIVTSGAYVSPPHGGWVTVYDQATESQDAKLLIALAEKLSKALNTMAFGFLVHDSDIAAYWLCEKGKLVDEFDSCPDYFGSEVSAAQRQKVRGDTKKLLPLCVTGTTAEQIDAVIHPSEEEGFSTFAEETIRNLGKLLGMDENRVSVGFDYLQNDGQEFLDDFEEFKLFEKGKKSDAKKPSLNKPRKVKAQEPEIPQIDMTYLGIMMAVSMMTKCWTGEIEEKAAAFSKMLPPDQAKGLAEKLTAQFDRGARDFLKKMPVPNGPTFEELKTARNAGPDALCVLLAQRVPQALASIAGGAIQEKQEIFLTALLKHGLDPNSKDHHGQTVLEAAARTGTDSPFYKMLKDAAEKKGS